MKKPIYLIVTPYFPSPQTWRGAYCYDFAHALMQTGLYDVRVLRPSKEADYNYQGIPVHCFKQKRLPSAAFPFLFAKENRLRFLQKLISLGIDLKEIAICHAHTALLSDYALAVKEKVPTCQALLHHHDLSSFGLDIGRLRMFWPYRLITAISLRKRHEAIDCHIFVSEASRQNFLAFPKAVNLLSADYRHQLRGLSYLRPPKIKATYVLHNGVRTDLFYPNRQPTKSFTLGCVANFIPIKGQRYLLEALSQICDQLGDWRLRLVGTGPTLHTCQKLAKQLNIEKHISFEPEMPHEDLPAFYNAIDLFVLPSYFEGFGCVCVEAHACHTPFIACEQQGLEELIAENIRNQWLCKPMDANDLAQKILRYYNSCTRMRNAETSIELPKLTKAIEIQGLIARFLNALNPKR